MIVTENAEVHAEPVLYRIGKNRSHVHRRYDSTGFPPVILPPRRSETDFLWESRIRFVHYIGDVPGVKDGERAEYRVLVATDSDIELGAFGNQTNELYVVNRESGLFYGGYWDGRLVWVGETPQYGLLVEGHVLEERRTFLTPSQFIMRANPMKVSRRDLWDLHDEGLCYPEVFYDHFSLLFSRSVAEPINRGNVRQEHGEFPVYDLYIFNEIREKRRQAEQREWKGLE